MSERQMHRGVSLLIALLRLLTLSVNCPFVPSADAQVIHGSVPALAWRVEIGGKSIVFSGDTNGEGNLVRLAKDADLFIAHNAVPEGAPGVERRLQCLLL
jgi:ribonuclease BN (tRNA processing enzyme)